MEYASYSTARHGALLDQLSRRTEQQFDGAVRYTQTGIVGAGATTMGAPELFSEDRLTAIKNHLDRFHRELFFLKLKDWESEHEYRYVARTPGEDYEYVDTRGSLRAVMVGTRFADWEVPSAAAACAAAGADARRVIWTMGRPRPASLARHSTGDAELPN